MSKVLKKFHNKTALITGASSGIGKAMAEQLAQQGCHLILVARRSDRLFQIAQQLQTQFGIDVHVMSLDLFKPNSAQQLFDQIQQQSLSVDILINNAGFGHLTDFQQHNYEHFEKMIQLNIQALTQLTHLFSTQMCQRRQGHILLVGSIGAWLPTPYMAVYAASKAYVRSLGLSLNRELAHYDVQVTITNPGGTATEFTDQSGQEVPAWVDKLLVLPAERVAKISLIALAKGRTEVIPGLRYKLSIHSLLLVPMAMITRGASLFFRPPTKK